MKFQVFYLLIAIIVLIYTGACRKQDNRQATPGDVTDVSGQEWDWPVFRGDPGLTGVAKGRLGIDLTLSWEYTTGKYIKSSPVIVDDRVYIGSYDGIIYALSVEDGSLIWSYDTGKAIEASPLVMDDVVYLGSTNGRLYALDAVSGVLRWEFETDAPIKGAANIVTGVPEQPPLVVVGSYDNFLYGIDSLSGEQVWSYEADNYINGCPAVNERDLVFGGCDGVLHIVAGDTGRSTGTVDINAYIAGSVAVSGDRAYFGHYKNKVVCVDLVRQRVVWEFESEKNKEPFFSSPAVVDDMVIIGSRDKYIYCLDKADGAVRWSFATLDEVDGSPVVCDGKVVVGSFDGRVYMLDVKDGALLWSYELGDYISGSPAVYEGMVVIGCEDGVVYAFTSP